MQLPRTDTASNVLNVLTIRGDSTSIELESNLGRILFNLASLSARPLRAARLTASRKPAKYADFLRSLHHGKNHFFGKRLARLG